jgi:hypothetical protein
MDLGYRSFAVVSLEDTTAGTLTVATSAKPADSTEGNRRGRPGGDWRTIRAGWEVARR